MSNVKPFNIRHSNDDELQKYLNVKLFDAHHSNDEYQNDLKAKLSEHQTATFECQT